MDIVAPVACRIAHLPVGMGTEVVAGATIVVLEVMKMEHLVMAPTAGVVTVIEVAVGDLVAEGDLILSMEEIAASDDVSREVQPTATDGLEGGAVKLGFRKELEGRGGT